MDSKRLCIFEGDVTNEFVSAQNLPRIQGEIGAALVCYRMMNFSSDNETQPWQSFHVSRRKASQAYEKIHKDLAKYSIIDDNWPHLIISPEGLEIPCHEALLFD